MLNDAEDVSESLALVVLDWEEEDVVDDPLSVADDVETEEADDMEVATTVLVIVED